MLIEIPNDVALRLQDLAAERGCTVGEILRDWMAAEPDEKQYGTLADMVENARAANLGNASSPPPGSLAALAENARKANLDQGTATDTAARSREILKAEFPDYIRRNWDRD